MKAFGGRETNSLSFWEGGTPWLPIRWSWSRIDPKLFPAPLVGCGSTPALSGASSGRIGSNGEDVPRVPSRRDGSAAGIGGGSKALTLKERDEPDPAVRGRPLYQYKKARGRSPDSTSQEIQARLWLLPRANLRKLHLHQYQESKLLHSERYRALW